jgi:hypothetical protein
MMILSPMGDAIRKFEIFLNLPNSQKGMVLEAIGYLTFARIWLVLSPFQKVAIHLGDAYSPQDIVNQSHHSLSEANEAQARQISWAIGRASRNAPLRAVCLQQAIAAKLMLRKRAITSTLHFGVAKGGKAEGLRAHAWLNSANVKVCGYPVPADLREIAAFV